ncbi:hypothetical protein A3842_06760 [Paenibacillus sp. P3E]|uniref:hypothetical protein n=1 Tax=Paenibacillus sp. P3E TaxID=1349435 RepID=UPI00093EF665|nr:hypothetical protein [Paenibacillus sp. P3E]OKP86099.1 hypothetical protein A3842_06760 [Paenibacillus sp. P3E]
MAYDAAGGFFELDMGRFGEQLGEELTESLEILHQIHMPDIDPEKVLVCYYTVEGAAYSWTWRCGRKRGFDAGSSFSACG